MRGAGRSGSEGLGWEVGHTAEDAELRCDSALLLPLPLHLERAPPLNPPPPSGFRVFIDGELAAQRRAAAAGAALTGGGPIELSGSLSLCARPDGAPGRYFAGLLAHLSLWDVALSAADVRALHAHIARDLSAQVRAAL